MSALAVELSLLAFLVATAVLVAVSRDVLTATVLFAAYSLVLSLLWLWFGAPDVALTEAAVGAGVVSVLFLAAIARTTASTADEAGIRWPALVGVLALGVGILATVPSLPSVGDPEAVSQLHLGAYYLANAPAETGVSNFVTAILAAYRAFDTFGEVVVVFAAGVGTLLVLGRTGITGGDVVPTARAGSGPGDPEPSVVATTAVRVVAPFVAVFGLYVGFHGATSPGGGFQGGVVVAASVVLLAFAFGIEPTREWIDEAAFSGLTAGGIAVVAVLGLGSVVLGAQFLEFGAYPLRKATTYGIELFEVAIGATVTGVVLAFFFGLLPWTPPERRPDDAGGDGR